MPDWLHHLPWWTFPAFYIWWQIGASVMETDSNWTGMTTCSGCLEMLLIAIFGPLCWPLLVGLSLKWRWDEWRFHRNRII